MHGNGSVISMHSSIHSVSCVLSVEIIGEDADDEHTQGAGQIPTSPVSYRTVDGFRVQNCEMKDGGYETLQ